MIVYYTFTQFFITLSNVSPTYTPIKICHHSVKFQQIQKSTNKKKRIKQHFLQYYKYHRPLHNSQTAYNQKMKTQIMVKSYEGRNLLKPNKIVHDIRPSFVCIICTIFTLSVQTLGFKCTDKSLYQKSKNNIEIFCFKLASTRLVEAGHHTKQLKIILEIQVWECIGEYKSKFSLT